MSGFLFVKNHTKIECVLVQVHKPRESQGFVLDKYWFKYYNKHTGVHEQVLLEARMDHVGSVGVFKKSRPQTRIGTGTG